MPPPHKGRRHLRVRSRYHPNSPAATADRPHCTLNAGERLLLFGKPRSANFNCIAQHGFLYSKERLRGEFIVCAYRFAPPTGSLESPRQLLLLINAFNSSRAIIKKTVGQSQAVLFFQVNWLFYKIKKNRSLSKVDLAGIRVPFQITRIAGEAGFS